MANIPEDLKYTRTHEWVRLEGDVVTLGITDFAQHELSDIVYVEVTTVGKTVKNEEAIGTIEAVKAVSDLYAPVAGTVVEGNESLRDSPATVNQDPYGAGWIAKIKVASQSELAGLLDAAAYAEVVKKSVHH
ncbi:glycine cleavage system protein GcvH [candidate division WOR-3 bacterium]|nr:glycine cleavage system protein GcvH [candidate division WOR-3 bacterium]